MAVDDIQTELLRPHRPSDLSPLPVSTDPIEIALKAVNAGAPPDSPAAMLLVKQGGLIDEQRRLVNIQIAGERMGVALKALTAVVGVVVALALGSMVWSASQERGLVIEPFSVPPDFDQRGVTGQVIASRLLDRLSEMAEQTVSVRAPSTYANNWNGDIKVQIPQTGVSVGELRRTLVEWLGKQTTIGGELYRTPQGLTLAARTGTAAATAQAGASEGELDRMIQAAAESVYATSQPYRYAVYLGRTQGVAGLAKSKEALLRLTRSGDEADRMWAYAALNLRYQVEGDFQAAIRATDASIAIAPKFNLAYANRAGALSGLGHDEAALRDNLEAASTARSHGARYMREEGLNYVIHAWRAVAAAAVGDFQTAADASREALMVRPENGQTMFMLGTAQLAQHEVGTAFEMFSALPKPDDGADVHELAVFAQEQASIAAKIAFEREDWAAVHRLVVSVDETHLLLGERIQRLTGELPYAALALARSGDARRAEALIASTPIDCYTCVWARGAVAALAGDARESDRWFAEAVRLGPSLPFSHAEWGRARLARGDVDGAIAMFAKAHEKGPRWADPLKFWGDALVRKGDHAAAIRKYSDAADRAPRWGALHLARGLALPRAGT